MARVRVRDRFGNGRVVRPPAALDAAAELGGGELAVIDRFAFVGEPPAVEMTGEKTARVTVESETGQTQTLDLVRVDGDWKVGFSK